MLNQFSRTELLLGSEAMERLASSRVAVFGIGGVGGYVTEALVRSGIGEIDIIDNDCVALTNINRQIYATLSTIGQNKVDVAANRIHDINPNCTVHKHPHFYMPSDPGDIDFSKFSYVVDAIDTVTAKLDIVQKAKSMGIPIISCMGVGNRLDPTKLKVADLFETSYDPLSKVMRRECKKRGIKELQVIYSTEGVIRPVDSLKDSCRYDCISTEKSLQKEIKKRDIPGSTSFVPPVAGLFIASVVVRKLCQLDELKEDK